MGKINIEVCKCGNVKKAMTSKNPIGWAEQTAEDKKVIESGKYNIVKKTCPFCSVN